MSGSISVRGGLRVGWLHASWPLARLTASEHCLSVAALMLGAYDFTPDQMIALEPHGNVPVIGHGIRLRHSRPDYPRRIVFWCAGSPEQLIARIQREVGFVPRSPGAAAPAMQTGTPVRLRALVVAAATWMLLGLLGGFTRWMGGPPPGPFPLLLLGSVFLGAAAIRRSPDLQTWVLKPGRSVGEIRAVLSVLQLVSGILLAVLGAVLVVVRVTGS
jgi:hypothetical protein